MKTTAKEIALGGIMAALAMVIMCLVGLIPFATYVCPMLCAIVCFVVYRICSKRIAWAWYFAVSLLSLFLAPDKEAAVMFVFLGYYPIIQPIFRKNAWGFILKLLYFNFSIFLIYKITVYVLGLDYIAQDYAEFGLVGLIIILVMGNVCFFMLDFALEKFKRIGKKK